MANSVQRVGTQTNFTVDQGSSYEHVFILRVNGELFDLTGFDARMQIRRSYGAKDNIFNGTLPNGKLAFKNAVAGQLAVLFSSSDFTAVKFNNIDDETLDCVYDLEIIAPTGFVSKPAQGSFSIVREVTR